MLRESGQKVSKVSESAISVTVPSLMSDSVNARLSAVTLSSRCWPVRCVRQGQGELGVPGDVEGEWYTGYMEGTSIGR